jgi:rhodanese-related sulfurtransferase
MDASLPVISVSTLAASMVRAGAPLLLDVRLEADLADSPVLIPGARRRDPEAIERWIYELPRDRPIVAYCVKGAQVCRGAAMRLRAVGYDAAYLEGGIRAWQAAGLPTVKSLAACGLGDTPSRWVTRARPKIDRIACPWLILRFIDPEARILYAPTAEVRTVADAADAEPFDVADARFGHVEDRCSFDAFIEIFGIRDPALDALARIVRGADTGRPDLAPESAGLLAVSRGLSALHADDHMMLRHGLTVYDALYAACRAGRS